MTRGERNIEWMEAHLRVPEGRDVGKPLRFRPFQREIILGIYDNPVSLRYAIISMAKKNAKTTLSGALLLLHLCGPESKPNSQLYSTGQSREQAAVIFALASKMVRASADIVSVVNIKDSAKELVCNERGTVFKALAADAHTAHGKSPIFVVHDELGQVRGPRSDLFDALETADGAHDEPLSLIISTQAPTDGDLLSILIDDGLKGTDPATRVWLWTADETGHKKDKKWAFGLEAMRQANPALGDFLSERSITKKAERALRMPSAEATYRNFNLNQRIDPTSPLISQMIWNACAGVPSIDALESGIVYAGLDLSARQDLTALAFIVQDDDRQWHAWCEFFAPSVGLVDRSRRDRVPYDVWADQGWITLTPGASVDYEIPAMRLIEICDDYDVRRIAFDRWRMDVFEKELQRLGAELPLVPHGQGFRDMSPAIDSLEAALTNEQILHGANPVLTMCAANARATRDPAGNRKLDKARATGRIDGLQALAMAFGASGMADEDKDGPSVYEGRGMVELDL